MKKIRNVDLSICNGEQKTAYNFCFRYSDVYLAQEEDKDAIIDGLLLPIKCFKDLDFNLVSGYVHRNIERYVNSKRPILMSCKGIGNFFK